MALATEQITNTLTLTQPAADAVREVMAQKNLQGYALRLFISGGGCSGYQYGLALDNRFRADDSVMETDGIKLVIDEVSIQYMQGATVDYVTEGDTSGFRIINPNPISACSCGQSASSESDPESRCSECG